MEELREIIDPEVSAKKNCSVQARICLEGVVNVFE
jgi:hypothetical protein